MSRRLGDVCLIVLVCIAVTLGAAEASKAKWATYKGAWFSIQYPAQFKARGSLKSVTSTAGCDSAFFKSPDGLVEFYVFSPRWNGNPTDIAINPKTEAYISCTPTVQGKKHIVRATIKAKNGSYLRSFVDTEDRELNTRLVFGIKYRNQKACNKYKSDYLKFKGSLVQYGD